MRKRALMGCMSHRAAGDKEETILASVQQKWPDIYQCFHCGVDSRGAPSAISMAVIPQDHRSLCRTNHPTDQFNRFLVMFLILTFDNQRVFL